MLVAAELLAQQPMQRVIHGLDNADDVQRTAIIALSKMRAMAAYDTPDAEQRRATA